MQQFTPEAYHAQDAVDAVIVLQQQEPNPEHYIPVRTNYSLEYNL